MSYEDIKEAVKKHGAIWQDDEGHWYVSPAHLGEGETEEEAIGMAALALWPGTGVPTQPGSGEGLRKVARPLIAGYYDDPNSTKTFGKPQLAFVEKRDMDVYADAMEAALRETEQGNKSLDTHASRGLASRLRDRAALSKLLLQVFLIFTILPAGCSGVRANSQPVTKDTVNLLQSIPVVEFSVNPKVLSGKTGRIERRAKCHRSRYEAACVIRRSGMRGNDKVCKSQRFLIGNDYKATDVSSRYAPTVNDVNLNERAFSKLSHRNVSHEDGSFGGGKLLPAKFERPGSGSSGTNRGFRSFVSFNPLTMVVDNGSSQAEQSEYRDNNDYPVSLDINPKGMTLGVCFGLGLSLLTCAVGLITIKSAGAIVDISVANATKVVFGLLLEVLAFWILQRTLGVMDGI